MGLSEDNGTDNSGRSGRAEMNAPPPDEVMCCGPSPGRRDVLSHGVKLAFVAPVLSTFFAKDAYAATYSCYPAGHACPGNEPCCNGLSCNNGTCGDPCVESGELCFFDSDCCSGDCQLGVCQ